VFGDMGDTFISWSAGSVMEEIGHALEGSVYQASAYRVRRAGPATRRQRRPAGPPFRHQPQDRLQVAGPCCRGRPRPARRPLPPAPHLPGPHRRPAGAPGAATARPAPGLGQPPVARPPAGLGTARRPRRQYHHRPPPPPRPPRRPAGGPGAGRATLRARRSQRPVAEGLQGPLRPDRWPPLPSPDGAGRPLPLRPGPAGPPPTNGPTPCRPP
jgi:hypothetical protein